MSRYSKSCRYRGTTVQQLIESELWWRGPEFLKHEESQWPPIISKKESEQSALIEVVKQPPVVTHVFAATQDACPRLHVNRVIKIDTFSSLMKLLRVTATVISFLNKLKLRLKNTERDPCETAVNEQLIAGEINYVRTQWILSVQGEFYDKELNAVIRNDPNPPAYVKQFGLFLDDNRVLRCKGRLGNSSLAYTAKNPVLLPAKHHLSSLVIKDAHNKTMHSGVHSTLTCLREDYWIPRGRESVKRFIKQCLICARFSGKPFALMPPPQLPRERVDEGPPWSNTGVD